MVTGILNTVGGWVGSTLSVGNQVVSGAMSLTGGTLSLVAKGSDVVLDSVMEMTGMSGGLLHKTGQVGISLLDTGASLTKAYDLVVGNNPTDPDVVLNDDTRLQDIEDQVRDIINGTAPGVNEHTQVLVAQIISFSQQVVPDQMTQEGFIAAVFSGAHVVIADEGLQFARWSSETNLPWENRQSSHYQEPRMGGGLVNSIKDKFSPLSETPQKGMDLPRGLGHLLIGRMPEDQGGHTFFQLEGHGTSAREFFPHMTDFVLHKSSGNAQVGPLGLIKMTEKPDSEGVSSHILVNPDDTPG